MADFRIYRKREGSKYYESVRKVDADCFSAVIARLNSGQYSVPVANGDLVLVQCQGEYGAIHVLRAEVEPVKFIHEGASA